MHLAQGNHALLADFSLLALCLFGLTVLAFSLKEVARNLTAS